MPLHATHEHLAALIAAPVNETMIVDRGGIANIHYRFPSSSTASHIRRRSRGCAQRAREALAHFIKERFNL